jgi:hypothetical protein
MPARHAAAAVVAALVLGVFLPAAPAAALDSLKVAAAQRGQWDTAITELGQRSGIYCGRNPLHPGRSRGLSGGDFRKHGHRLRRRHRVCGRRLR